MFKIWPITSFEEYKNSWQSIANEFTILTTYQKKNYNSPEDFFNKNAYAAQQLANDRVGGILERVFSTTELAPAVQNELKKFTYRAIDYLRMNDSEVMQIDRQNQTSYNNGRSDLTQISTFSNLELVIGSSAWRAWTNSKIEKLYASYSKEYNIDFLLDPNEFYNKVEIDKFLAEIDDAIQSEHVYTNLKNEEVNDKIDTLDNLTNNRIDDLTLIVDTKQNINDQVLLQQSLNENDEPIGEIQKLGYFDEIMIQSNKPNSTIVTTPYNKKRAIVNLNSTIGELVSASIFQTSSETDDVNAIGRIWGWGLENELNQIFQNLQNQILELKNELDEKKLDKSEQWLVGEYKWVKAGTIMPVGWARVSTTNGFTLINTTGASTSSSSGSVSSHKHDIKFTKSTPPITSGNYSELASTKTTRTAWGYPGSTPSSGSAKSWASYGLVSKIGNISSSPHYFIYGKNISVVGNEYDFTGQTENLVSGTNNLAAGIYAQLWIYTGIESKTGKTRSFEAAGIDEVNFTVPYWDEIKKSQEKEQAKIRKLAETPTFADLEPIKEEVNEIKNVVEEKLPIVNELDAKEKFRMKKLGIDPNSNYWKESDDDGEK